MFSRGGVAIAVIFTASLAGRVAATGAPGSGRLVAFGSCPALLGYVKGQAARFVTPYGLGRPVGIAVAPRAAPNAGAPQQGVDYSGTNVQEAGVDEPDVVKTNGVTP